MNETALRTLEFQRVLEGCADRAASEAGREAIRALSPGTDPAAIREALAAVAETMRFLDAEADWVPPTIPDARPALRRLRAEGSPLEPLELFSLGVLLTAGRLLGQALPRSGSGFPHLSGLIPKLQADEALERRIQETVEVDGTILDSASRELRRIRSDLRRAHARVVQQLDAFLRDLPDRYRVPDASLSLREGRYVIPIRREGKSDIGGIIHGESATGATLFVEPPLAIRLMNDLQELERAEVREIDRILGELTGRLHPHHGALAESQATLVHYDTLHARARTAVDWKGHVPELLPPGPQGITIVEGRHPLLVLAGGVRVVPFSLSLEPHERAMVVSGPNTGGKSVLLKALALIPALAQSGIIPPVGPGSSFPVFDGIFADIGDGQSIAESLSTFSAHLTRLREIVEEAGPASLVLVDEMGTGTDPREGAALARAILEELVRRGTLTIATSHLGDLKRLDTPGSGIVNASLQFDPERIEPTYQLVKGRPGRSYGLAIAGRLGFPPELLEAARSHLSMDEVNVEELLATLERREKETGRVLQELETERGATARLREELEARETALREREKSAERRAAEEARKVLLEAREEVDRAIAGVKEARAGEVEERAKEARRRVEKAADRQKKRSSRADRVRERPPAPPPGALSPGDRVRLRSGGAVGTLLEVRDDRAVVESSGLRLQVPLADVVPARREEVEAARREAAAIRARGSWDGPTIEASTEVHLRGMRIEEMEMELERALDAAILADLPELRIVHGKGTGALRSRVHELLRGDTRVRSFRPGGTGEGGFGVTVARLAG